MTVPVDGDTQDMTIPVDGDTQDMTVPVDGWRYSGYDSSCGWMEILRI